MRPEQAYHADHEIMNGAPVFVGTRVPVHTLTGPLAPGVSLDGFLDAVPSVTRKQAVALLALSEAALVGANA